MTYYAGIEDNAIVSVTGEPTSDTWMILTDDVANDIVDNPRLLMEYVVLGDEVSGRQLVLRSELTKYITGELFLLQQVDLDPDCVIVLNKADGTAVLDPRTRFLYPLLVVYLTDPSGLLCKCTVTYYPTPFLNTMWKDTLIFSNQHT
jgi:hypothetical protein